MQNVQHPLEVRVHNASEEQPSNKRENDKEVVVVAARGNVRLLVCRPRCCGGLVSDVDRYLELYRTRARGNAVLWVSVGGRRERKESRKQRDKERELHGRGSVREECGGSCARTLRTNWLAKTPRREVHYLIILLALLSKFQTCMSIVS
jgi:hypothetical protein